MRCIATFRDKNIAARINTFFGEIFFFKPRNCGNGDNIINLLEFLYTKELRKRKLLTIMVL